MFTIYLHFEFILELFDLLAGELGELGVDGGLGESGLDGRGSVHSVRRPLAQQVTPTKQDPFTQDSVGNHTIWKTKKCMAKESFSGKVLAQKIT